MYEWQIILAAAGIVLISVGVGFWMGVKTQRPEEKVFIKQERSDRDDRLDREILNTPDMFDESANLLILEDEHERVDTV